jgi:hypothetical protein
MKLHFINSLLFLSFFVTTNSFAQSLESQAAESEKILKSTNLLIDDYANSSLVTGTRKILFLDEGYVPQGIHVSTSHYYLSMYHKNIEGITDTKPSIVVKYTIAGEFVSKIALSSSGKMFTGHVGGLSIIDDYILLPEGKKIYYFNLETGALKKTETLDFLGSNSEIENISFMNISQDHSGRPVLLVGEFREKKSSSKPNYIFGYLIDKSSGKISTIPTYRFTVPESISKIQGVTLISASASSYSLLFSTSYGDDPSKLYKVSYAYSYDKNVYNRYTISSESLVFKGPAGLENVYSTASRIWTLSESGAQYFQKRTDSKPWNTNFPFVLLLDKSKI